MIAQSSRIQSTDVREMTATAVAVPDAVREQSARERVDPLRRLVPGHGAPALRPLLEVRGRGRRVANGVAPELGRGAPLHVCIVNRRRKPVRLEFAFPMRTIWNGSISFGLVNIPVGLALATQRQDVSFRTLHRECGSPIKQKRWCPVHERDVEPDELVKGWEFAKGQYVLVEESDLEAVALHAVAVDRDSPLRPPRGCRPRLLRPHVLPRAGRRRGAAQAVRPAAARDGGVGHGGGREVRALGQGEPLPHPRAGAARSSSRRCSSPRTCARRRRSRTSSARRRSPRPSSSSRARSSRASRASGRRRTLRTTTARISSTCSRRSSPATRSSRRSRSPRRR